MRTLRTGGLTVPMGNLGSSGLVAELPAAATPETDGSVSPVGPRLAQ